MQRLGVLKVSQLLGLQFRSMAVFSEQHIHPIFHPREQQKLVEAETFKKLTFELVKPVRSNQNASAFYDEYYHKVINHLMKGGNKILARDLLDNTFASIKRIQLKKLKQNPADKDKLIINPYKILHLAIENARPFLQTTAVKRGGHTYQVPVPIRPSASLALAIKWLIEAGNDGKDKNTRFYYTFAKELIDSSNGVGRVIKRKQDLHRLCEANRAYAHYRWS